MNYEFVSINSQIKWIKFIHYFIQNKNKFNFFFQKQVFYHKKKDLAVIEMIKKKVNQFVTQNKRQIINSMIASKHMK